MSLFNKNFLLQNIKKSKGSLAVFLGLIPILNILTLIAIISNKNIVTLNIFEMSFISMIGLYITPLVASISLFGFVFKRKSVDFVNSMPISRKSIFITNTIGGSLLLLLIVLINILGFVICTLIFKNLIIPIPMMVDYFVVWSISYIFTFTVTNLAMTISGNAITQIIVTIILLFLCPILTDYTSTRMDSNFNNVICSSLACKPNSYYCYSDEECLKNEKMGIYRMNISSYHDFNESYNMPYQLFKITANNTQKLYDSYQLLKMVFFSLISIYVGFILFDKRKMEDSEISFKSIHKHSIVKCLTMVPFLLIIFELHISLIGIFIIFTLLIAYFFIYDLITKRGIHDLKISLFYFLSAVVVVFAYYTLTQNFYLRSTEFNVNDIDTIIIDESNSKNILEPNLNTVIKNKTAINLIMSEYISTFNNVEQEKKYLPVLIKAKNKTYKTSVIMREEKYEELVKLISYSAKKINFDAIYAITIDDSDYILNASSRQKIIKYIKEAIDNEGYNTNYVINNVLSIYMYENHTFKRYYLPISINSELEQYVANLQNAQVAKLKIDKTTMLRYYCDINVCENTDLYYIFAHSLFRDELEDFVKKNKLNRVNTNSKHITIHITHHKRNYLFYTNNLTEFSSIITRVRDKIKETDDYKKYINSGAIKVYE